MSDDNREKFSGRAQDYSAYRTRYPAQLFSAIEKICSLQRERLIVDVGAGTGMLAEVFLPHEYRVIAIEPNAEMLAECDRLMLRYPLLQTVQATAEHTTLATHSVDVIAAGRAFHWFDTEKARAEFQRILRPGGWVVLASVGRRRGDTPLEREYEDLLLRTTPEYADTVSRFHVYESPQSFFGHGDVFHQEIEDTEPLTLPMLEGQTRSLSCMPLQGDARYAHLSAGLSDLFRRYARHEVVHMPIITHLTCGQFA